MLSGMSIIASADTGIPTAKIHKPVECTDSVNYDQTDCAVIPPAKVGV